MQQRKLDVESDGAVQRYSKLYEEELNPFQSFHRREQSQRVANLPTHEKVTLRGYDRLSTAALNSS